MTSLGISNDLCHNNHLNKDMVIMTTKRPIIHALCIHNVIRYPQTLPNCTIDSFEEQNQPHPYKASVHHIGCEHSKNHKDRVLYFACVYVHLRPTAVI